MSTPQLPKSNSSALHEKPVQGRHVNHESCPVVEASKYVGDFWSLWIVRVLLDHPARFSELTDCIPSINKVTLTAKLKLLSEAGMIEKKMIDEHVTYSLTAKGQDLSGVITALKEYANKHF